MPLPDAPPPKTSRVYQQFAGKLLSTITSDNFDTVKDPIYIDRNSEDEIRRLNLIGQASNTQSQSGAIPDTFQVIEVDVTSASTFDVFTVPQGETWRLVAAGSEAFATNQSYVILKLKDNSNSKSVRIDALSGGFTEYTLNEPIDITYPCIVQVVAGASGTWSGTNQNQFAFVKMR